MSFAGVESAGESAAVAGVDVDGGGVIADDVEVRRSSPTTSTWPPFRNPIRRRPVTSSRRGTSTERRTC